MFYEAHDPRFSRFVMFNAPVKKLATGFDWAEGSAMPGVFCSLTSRTTESFAGLRTA
jgi:hypothetical protein